MIASMTKTHIATASMMKTQANMKMIPMKIVLLIIMVFRYSIAFSNIMCTMIMNNHIQSQTITFFKFS